MRVTLLTAAALLVLAGASSARADSPTAEAAGLRLLTWPGKVAPAERARRPSVRAPATRYADPSAAPRAPAPLPASIYAQTPPPARSPAAPAIAATPLAQAQTPAAPGSDYTTPRFYSLHRAYGQTPDPIPLSPQFFATQTPDLAEPPPPPPRTVTTANGQVVRTTDADTSVN